MPAADCFASARAEVSESSTSGKRPENVRWLKSRVWSLDAEKANFKRASERASERAAFLPAFTLDVVTSSWSSF
jgi:hypothetical protein